MSPSPENSFFTQYVLGIAAKGYKNVEKVLQLVYTNVAVLRAD